MTPTAAERLRSATRPWHDTLETSGFAVALLAGRLPLDRYIGQLAAYRVVLAALETELSRTTCPTVAQVWSPELIKLPLVERDLRYFGATGGDSESLAGGGGLVAGGAGAVAVDAQSVAGDAQAPAGGAGPFAVDAQSLAADAQPPAPAPQSLAADAAWAFAAEIRRTAEADPRELLGFLYVLEGSTLGALFLRPRLCAAHHLGDTDGTAYYASGDRSRWGRLTTRLNETLADPEAQDRVIAAAERAYRHTAAVTAALSRGLTADGS